MTVVFLLDTSPSMNQRLDGPLSAFELAKSGIELFIKTCNKRNKHDNHKYMLVTYDHSDNPVKTSFNDDEHSLLRELKVLQALDDSSPNAPLSALFHHLDVNRVQHGRDTPGMGSFPGLLDPTVILWFTDGGRISHQLGVLEKLDIQKYPPGMEIYNLEPFRWDQRLYVHFLQPEGTTMHPQFKIMAEATGGQAWQLWCSKQLQIHIEYMLGAPGNACRGAPMTCSPVAAWHGVTIRFQQMPMTTENGQQNVFPPFLKFIHLDRNSRHPGYFPIPESYWPDQGLPGILPRHCHPTLTYLPSSDLTTIPAGLPFDKYALDVDQLRPPCPLMASLLGRPSSAPPGWPVFVQGSHKSDPNGYGFPCGFLRANTAGTGIFLYIVPYNYKVFFSLLEKRQPSPNSHWIREFHAYLADVPSYYAGPLRHAMKRLNLAHLMPSKFGVMGKGMLQHVEKIRGMAKGEFDLLLGKNKRTQVQKTSLELPNNAFDIPRDQLLARLMDFKLVFANEVNSQSGRPIDDQHSKPIALMGEMPSAEKQREQALRPLDEEVEKRQTVEKLSAFGSLYKNEKPRSVTRDTVDEQWENIPPDSPMLGPSRSEDASAISTFLLKSRTRKRQRSCSPAPYDRTLIPPLSPALLPESRTPISGIPTLRVKGEQKFWVQRRSSSATPSPSPSPLILPRLGTSIMEVEGTEPDAEYPMDDIDEADAVVLSPPRITAVGEDVGFVWDENEMVQAADRIMAGDQAEDGKPEQNMRDRVALEDSPVTEGGSPIPRDRRSATPAPTFEAEPKGSPQVHLEDGSNSGATPESSKSAPVSDEPDLENRKGPLLLNDDDISMSNVEEDATPRQEFAELQLPYSELVELTTRKIRAHSTHYDESHLGQLFSALLSPSSSLRFLEKHALVARSITVAEGMRRQGLVRLLRNLRCSG